MERHSAGLDANLAPLEERLARLPTKSFWRLATAVQIVAVSGVIRFREELQALIGM
jgi:hypothetical protein